jgi:hypothetical protein
MKEGLYEKTITNVSLAIVIVLSYAFYEDDPKRPCAGYVGTQGCVCHSAYITSWKTTLHSQIHMTRSQLLDRAGQGVLIWVLLTATLRFL